MRRSASWLGAGAGRRVPPRGGRGAARRPARGCATGCACPAPPPARAGRGARRSGRRCSPVSDSEAHTSKTASTREAVTLACCPPGPDERLVRSSISLSGMAARPIRNGSSMARDATRRGKLPAHARRGGRAYGVVRVRKGVARPEAGRDRPCQRTFEEPGGGGAVAAVQLMKLAGSASLFTAFGDDEVGHRSHARLEELGVEIEGGFRPEPQRRGFVHVDDQGERTHGAGPRPARAGPMPSRGRLDDTDAVYLTAGDVDAVRQLAARACSWPPRAGSTRCRRRTWSSTRSCRAARPRRDLPRGRPRSRAEDRVRTLGATGRVGDRLRRARRRDPAPLPARSRTPGRAGDSFAADSPTASGRMGDRQGRGAGRALRGGVHDGQRPLRGQAALYLRHLAVVGLWKAVG